jgi:hypothetical protein
MGGQILTLYFGEGEIGGKGRCRFEISLLPFYESYNSTSDIVPEIYSSIRAPGSFSKATCRAFYAIMFLLVLLPIISHNESTAYAIPAIKPAPSIYKPFIHISLVSK